MLVLARPPVTQLFLAERLVESNVAPVRAYGEEVRAALPWALDAYVPSMTCAGCVGLTVCSDPRFRELTRATWARGGIHDGSDRTLSRCRAARCRDLRRRRGRRVHHRPGDARRGAVGGGSRGRRGGSGRTGRDTWSHRGVRC